MTKTHKTMFAICGLLFLLLLSACSAEDMGISVNTTASSTQASSVSVSQPQAQPQQASTDIPLAWTNPPDPAPDGSCFPQDVCTQLETYRYDGVELYQAMQSVGMSPVDLQHGLTPAQTPDNVLTAWSVGQNEAGTEFRFFYWTSPIGDKDTNWRHHVVASSVFTRANLVDIPKEYVDCPNATKPIWLVEITSSVGKASVHYPKNGWVGMSHPQFGGDLIVYVSFVQPTDSSTNAIRSPQEYMMVNRI